MDPNPFDYARLVEEALLSVVRHVLHEVAGKGLSPPHHLYLTFSTQVPGVTLPSVLLASHPQEMTIVLQHQFWNLCVHDEGFSVEVAFDEKRESLFVPWRALLAFSDPSVPFSLRFAESTEPPPSEEGTPPDTADAPPENVVSLETFRTKT